MIQFEENIALDLDHFLTADNEGWDEDQQKSEWVVYFLGVATMVRLGQVNWEDARWVQGMNRIRHAYLDAAPELEPYFVTVRYHHWHHAADKNAVDVNFAIHLPFLDRLFGTHYLPKTAWPERYGLIDVLFGSLGLAILPLLDVVALL